MTTTKENERIDKIPIDVLKDLTPKEAIRIAYIPTVVAQAASKYINIVADTLCQRKMPYKKETRIIRENLRQFQKDTLYELQTDTYRKLESVTEDFFYDAGKHIDILYFTVYQELMNQYKDLEEYDLFSYIYVVKSLLEYIKWFQKKAEKRLTEVSGKPAKVDFDPRLEMINQAMDSVAKGYKRPHSKLIDLAIEVIKVKVDEHVFSEVEIVEDPQETDSNNQ